jgi:hypothetical protein
MRMVKVSHIRENCESQGADASGLYFSAPRIIVQS